MRKICKVCGCYLDPGEWCDCEDAPEVDRLEARVPVKRRRPTMEDLYARFMGIDKEEYRQ